MLLLSLFSIYFWWSAEVLFMSYRKICQTHHECLITCNTTMIDQSWRNQIERWLFVMDGRCSNEENISKNVQVLLHVMHGPHSNFFFTLPLVDLSGILTFVSPVQTTLEHLQVPKTAIYSQDLRKIRWIFFVCMLLALVSISVNDRTSNWAWAHSWANNKAVHFCIIVKVLEFHYQRKKRLCRPKTVAFTHCRQAWYIIRYFLCPQKNSIIGTVLVKLA